MGKSKYTQEAVDAIFEAFTTIDEVTGLRCSVERAARSGGVDKRTFFNWVAKYPEFRQRYLESLQATSIFMYEELLKIADDSSGDTTVDSFGNKVMDKEWVQRSKLRVEARKWAMSKLMPKVFGDNIKVDHEVKGSVSINIIPAQLPGNVPGTLATSEDEVDLKRDFTIMSAEAIENLRQRGEQIEDADYADE